MSDPEMTSARGIGHRHRQADMPAEEVPVFCRVLGLWECTSVWRGRGCLLLATGGHAARLLLMLIKSVAKRRL